MYLQRSSFDFVATAEHDLSGRIAFGVLVEADKAKTTRPSACVDQNNCLHNGAKGAKILLQLSSVDALWNVAHENLVDDGFFRHRKLHVNLPPAKHPWLCECCMRRQLCTEGNKAKATGDTIPAHDNSIKHSAVVAEVLPELRVSREVGEAANKDLAGDLGIGKVPTSHLSRARQRPPVGVITHVHHADGKRARWKDLRSSQIGALRDQIVVHLPLVHFPDGSTEVVHRPIYATGRVVAVSFCSRLR
mmetsp:Transcript_24159/g.53565  ORF Transcript_24159/g.53565 Transcript_24159/m.53565 type:complete len:247 (+) Transcript_24159:152-892(+)